MVRERQLAYQIHAVAAEGPAAWRQPATAAAAAPSPLLARRGCRTLSICVPHAATGIDAADTAVYVRSISVECRRPLPTRPLAMRAAKCSTAAPTPVHCSSAAPLQRLATPPALHEHPAKRTRTHSPAPRPGAAVRVAAAGHLIAPDVRSSCSCCDTSNICSSISSPTPVVLPMPPLAPPASSNGCRLVAPLQPAAAYTSSSPLVSWLQKIKSMLSPRSQHLTPVFVY